MSEKSNKWKDYLLKSSIPLEYQVKQLLDKYGCVSNYEYTYLRRDENEMINEFSYDIDSSYIKGYNFFQLMIECKYRDISTDWIFIPENYGGIDEIKVFSFIHPNDHFTKENKFLELDYEPYAPLCGKGIEINSNGQNPKTITQAVNQLSYAMAEKIVSGMEHQIEKLLSSTEFIFFDIPVIVTTANLFRLKENITIEQIKNSSDIREVSDEEDCLILKTPTGNNLENYNLQRFINFIGEYGKDELNDKLRSFNKDIEFVFSVIAKNYCPNAIAIIKFTEVNNGFRRLFEFFDEIDQPSEMTIKKSQEKKKLFEEISKGIQGLKKGKQHKAHDDHNG